MTLRADRRGRMTETQTHSPGGGRTGLRLEPRSPSLCLLRFVSTLQSTCNFRTRILTGPHDAVCFSCYCLPRTVSYTSRGKTISPSSQKPRPCLHEPQHDSKDSLVLNTFSLPSQWMPTCQAISTPVPLFRVMQLHHFIHPKPWVMLPLNRGGQSEVLNDISPHH